jgi:hypothetical protein
MKRTLSRLSVGKMVRFNLGGNESQHQTNISEMPKAISEP